MKKKILIIQGHPDSESFNYAIQAAYKKGALNAGAEIKEIHVAGLNFDPNLQYGYRKRTELEPSLIAAQEKIKWCDHIVLIYPIWWGTMPALLKGFFDRVFLPGFAFKKREGSLWWDKLLQGKTARVISTLDQPPWYYKLIYRAPSDRVIRKLIFDFCGIKPTRITNIGPIRLSTIEFRESWLKKIESLGQAQK